MGSDASVSLGRSMELSSSLTKSDSGGAELVEGVNNSEQKKHEMRAKNKADVKLVRYPVSDQALE